MSGGTYIECTFYLTLLILPDSSGQVVQSLNSAAVTWSLAKELYGINGPYVWIPLSLLFGVIPTFIQWLISKVFCVISLGFITSLKANHAIAEMVAYRSSPRRFRHPAHHLHVLFLDVCRHQLPDHILHHRRTRLPVVAAEIPSRLVPQVQLYPRWRIGRRGPNHDLRPLLRGVWRVWNTKTVPFLGW